MNFVQHTRAAHEHLLACPQARPHHVSLYWALFYAWNTQFFDPAGVQLYPAAMMQAARIGNERTFRAALLDLAAWGLLTYQPSRSRHHASRCQLTDLSGAAVPPVPGVTPGSSAPDKSSLPGAEVPEALGALLPPVADLPGAEVPEHSLVSKTGSTKTEAQNSSAAGPKKKEQEVFVGEGLSVAQVLDKDDPTAPGAAPNDFAPKANRVAQEMRVQHFKGVGERPPAAPREPRPRRPASLPELPFRQSPLYDLAAFTGAFAGTDYALVDLPHYHQLIDNWRDKKTGLPPTRRDWAATARRFMLNDAHDNRLKLAPGHQPHQPGAGPAAPDPGARPAGSGYRSKYDA